MAEQDPRAKYRELPPKVNSDDTVIDIDTTLADVEQPDPDYNEGRNRICASQAGSLWAGDPTDCARQSGWGVRQLASVTPSRERPTR
jgi:hypothetical protein